MSDLRDTILAADDLPREKVDVEEWGVAVWVRTMQAAERDAFELSVNDGKGGPPNLENFRARLVTRTVVDEHGERVFRDADAIELGEKSGRVLDDLFQVAGRLNGLSAESAEELAGNSAATHDDAPNGT